MKPIDEQNAVLLALRRSPATPNKLTTDLRAGGVSVTLHQVKCALERLEKAGLVEVTGELHETGSESRPFFSLTRAGQAEAGQLPEGIRA